MFGVLYGDLNRLAKKIGVDQSLAEQLWQSDKHDVRMIALMIADPKKISATLLDRWLASSSNQLLADAVAMLASKTKHARKRFEKWSKSRKELIACTAWTLLSLLAKPDRIEFENDEFADLLDVIETQIHSSPNWVRYTMNGALISIGTRNKQLHKKAITAANKIGKIDVDFGQTSCKLPAAIPYMKKIMDRQKTSAKKTTKRRTSKKTAG